MKTKNRNQRGFTWIEMVMIIVILGILAMIGIPRFIDFQAGAQHETVKSVKGS